MKKAKNQDSMEEPEAKRRKGWVRDGGEVFVRGEGRRKMGRVWRRKA